MKFSIKRRKLHIYTYFLALYFFLAPMEDLLTGTFGTLAKYIAILFVAAGLIESRGRFTLSKKTENILIILLTAVGMMSLLWSIDLETTLKRLPAYMLLPGYCVFASLLDFEEEDYAFISKAAVLGALLTVGYLFFTGRLSTTGRVTIADSSDPNNFAALLLLPLALCFQQRKSEKKAFIVLYSAIAILLLFCMLFTGSRGGLLSIAIVAIAFLLLTRANKKILYMAVLGLIILIVWFYVLPRLPERIRWRLFDSESYMLSEAREESRTGIWRNVFTYILPNMKLWGIGAGCSSLALSSVYGHLRGVHNTYLNMVCEYGVFGIGFFIAFLIVLITKLKARARYLELSCLIGMCFLIFFLDSYQKKFFWNVILIVYLAIKITPVQKQGQVEHSLAADEDAFTYNYSFKGN